MKGLLYFYAGRRDEGMILDPLAIIAACAVVSTILDIVIILHLMSIEESLIRIYSVVKKKCG
jgi:preprotein translocase subunit Sec61beta